MLLAWQRYRLFLLCLWFRNVFSYTQLQSTVFFVSPRCIWHLQLWLFKLFQLSFKTQVLLLQQVCLFILDRLIFRDVKRSIVWNVVIVLDGNLLQFLKGWTLAVLNTQVRHVRVLTGKYFTLRQFVWTLLNMLTLLIWVTWVLIGYRFLNYFLFLSLVFKLYLHHWPMMLLLKNCFCFVGVQRIIGFNHSNLTLFLSLI